MKTQSGNALWLILLAIFLLGGLTVLLSRTGSNTEETGSAEKTSLKASELLKYVGGLKNGVDALLAHGCSENQISFWYDSNGDGVENVSDTYYNSGAPIDRSCHMFSDKGAGLTFKIMNQLFPGGTYAYGMYNDFIGRENFTLIGGTAAPELHFVVSLPDQNGAALCRELNRQMGLSTTTPPTTTVWGGPAFTGSFYSPATNETIMGELGKRGYCYLYTATTDRFTLVYILMLR